MTFDKEKTLEHANSLCKGTLMETLNIHYVDAGEDFLTARMPVNAAVHQPDGVLHGGATVALAESVGSAAAVLFLNSKSHFVRGVEISANHVKSIREGHIWATATPLHKGRTLQLWDIRVTDKDGNLVSSVKLTSLSLPKKA